MRCRSVRKDLVVVAVVEAGVAKLQVVAVESWPVEYRVRDTAVE